MANPVRVAVTGAAGQIGYALLPRIAAGEMLGTDTEVILQLIEIPPAMDALRGVAMELDDCAFPLLTDMVLTDDPSEGFRDANVCLLVGAKPRGEGQERGDLIKDNGPIFTGQGEAIAEADADGVPAERFTAMTRLDQNRAMTQLAQKAGVPVTEVSNVAIWGNHSSTQFPDHEHALIGGKPAAEVIDDDAWFEDDFIPTVQQRGAAIIEARGQSSAMSAANAAIDHVRNWVGGRPTPDGDWVSMGVPTDGSYGFEPGVISSFPCRTDGEGGYEIVEDLDLSDAARTRIEASVQELRDEREVIADLL